MVVEPQGSELTIVPLEADEEVTTMVEVANEFPQDRGIDMKDQIQEQIELESGRRGDGPGDRQGRKKMLKYNFHSHLLAQ